MVTEKFYIMYEQDMNNPELKSIVMPQYEKNKVWFEKNKNNSPNKWFYLTMGDIITSCMQFMALPTAMAEGLY